MPFVPRIQILSLWPTCLIAGTIYKAKLWIQNNKKLHCLNLIIKYICQRHSKSTSNNLQLLFCKRQLLLQLSNLHCLTQTSWLTKEKNGYQKIASQSLILYLATKKQTSSSSILPLTLSNSTTYFPVDSLCFTTSAVRACTWNSCWSRSSLIFCKSPFKLVTSLASASFCFIASFCESF